MTDARKAALDLEAIKHAWLIPGVTLDAKSENVAVAACGTISLLIAEVERLRSSLLEPVGGWQPIESAPKDGTWIAALVIGYDNPVVIRFHEGRWVYDEDISARKPVRWIPLPPAPSTDGESDNG